MCPQPGTFKKIDSLKLLMQNLLAKRLKGLYLLHLLSLTCPKINFLSPLPQHRFHPLLLLLLDAGCTKTDTKTDTKCRSCDAPCFYVSFIARQVGLQPVLSGGVYGCDDGDPLTFWSLAAARGPLPPLPFLRPPLLPHPRLSPLLHLQRDRDTRNISQI